MEAKDTDLTQEKWYDKYSKTWRLYPHLELIPDREREGWECSYCHHFIPWGEPDENGYVSSSDGIGCTERHEPCQWCGEQPLCAPDCVGIRMLLSDPKIYVLGEVD